VWGIGVWFVTVGALLAGLPILLAGPGDHRPEPCRAGERHEIADPSRVHAAPVPGTGASAREWSPCPGTEPALWQPQLAQRPGGRQVREGTTQPLEEDDQVPLVPAVEERD